MRILLLSVVLHIWSLSHSSQNIYKIYIFLLEECIISQAYTQKLNLLYVKYANDTIQFTGFFPNNISSDSSVIAFKKRHNISFPCQRYKSSEFVQQFGIRVTPEVVIYNETSDSIYYQGRIDNMYAALGKRRRVITSDELNDALNSIISNKQIKISRTEPIGCILKP